MPAFGPTDDKSLKISIVTVVLNSCALIEDTVKSVLGQTYPDVEYIVVDGGSTDGTMDVITRYGDRIDSIVSEPDCGVYDAMNKARALCHGDVIYFLNAGDIICGKEIVSDVMQRFSAEDCGFVYGDAVLYDTSPESGTLRKSPENWRKALKRGGMICHQAMFARKAILERFDTTYRLAADFNLFCALSNSTVQAVRVGIPICFYRVNGISSDKEKLIREKSLIIRKHFGMPHAVRYRTVERIRAAAREMLICMNLLKYYHAMKALANRT
jgi:glycosyltransferase involved in cell wall biosynthesis